MKILFISEYIDEKGQGSYELARSHYTSLCNLLDPENVDLISIKLSRATMSELGGTFYEGFKNKRDILLNLLRGYPRFYNRTLTELVMNKIDHGSYEIIFFDNSYFGPIIKEIKKRHSELPIVTFSHGVKANSGRQTIKNAHFKPNVVLMVRNNIRAERLTVKYANINVLLNRRDDDNLEKYYGKRADFLLPIYYMDKAKIYLAEKNEGEFRILFLGGNFWPNILGITWFAENVMPFIQAMGKLYVVGRGLEVLRDNPVFQNKKNIEVVGTVDDLNYWYNSSDIVVGPIFHGEGMKTKTAEALMYGKRYIGTTEALCGYIGLEDYHCETAEEFITIINGYIQNGVPRYDPAMRSLYEKYYSVEAGNAVIREILQKVGAVHG